MTAPAVPPLVDAAWLAQRPEILVLDASVGRSTVDGHSAYTSGTPRFEVEGHLPAALPADLLSAFSDAQSGLPFTRPSATRFSVARAALGIRPDDHVVVYDSWDGTWAARLWWVFTSFGHARVSLLDGGLTAWKASGGPVEHGAGREPQPVQPPADAPQPVPGAFVDRDDVLRVVDGGREALLICGLRGEVYRGETAAFARPGHIPGSISLPYASLVNRETKSVEPDALAEALRALPADVPLITYCGGGVNAAGVAFALALAGRSDVSVYDGSLAEWVADPALPLVTGPLPLPSSKGQ
jgi:thiosulfate/3-mercaptopyruvate sulfurtransferase